MQFFSEWQELRFPRKIRSSCPAESYRNIDWLIADIVSSGKATLWELKTVYTLQDAMQLWEVVAVDRYNEIQAAEAAKKRAKRK